MKRLLSFALGCMVCVCVLIATEQRAMAMYVDPGSGLLALQSAASVLAAALAWQVYTQGLFFVEGHNLTLARLQGGRSAAMAGTEVA